MTKIRKLYIEMIIYLLFAYFLMILPYFKDINLSKISTLLFLNFGDFEILHLTKLSIKYITLFIIFFHMTFYQKISIVSENTSYLSMAIHKTGKKKSLKDILYRNMKDMILTYIFIIVCLGVMGVIVSYQNKMSYEYSVYLHIIIYLVKYFCLIYTLLTVFQIKSIIKNCSYSYLLSYGIFISFIIIDMTLGTSVMTLSVSITNELVYLLTTLGLECLCFIVIIYQFLKAKEVYND